MGAGSGAGAGGGTGGGEGMSRWLSSAGLGVSAPGSIELPTVTMTETSASTLRTASATMGSVAAAPTLPMQPLQRKAPASVLHSGQGNGKRHLSGT